MVRSYREYTSGAVYKQKIELHSPELYHVTSLAKGVRRFADVDEQQVAFYRDNGYLVVQEAFTPEEVAAARQGLTDLMMDKNPDFKGVWYEVGVEERLPQLSFEERADAVRKLMFFVDFDARLQAMADHPTLLGVVQRLIGEPARRFQDMALLKPPQGREKPWHQDMAYFNYTLDTPIVGVWIALDAATPQNGCMHIQPGSHRQGPVLHFVLRDWQICDTEMLGKPCRAVPLAPGGCLFFHSLLRHGTPYNGSQQRRWAVQFHYAPEQVVKISQEERLAIFGAEGKDVEC
jgi:phytanoyl-CoA hydroxylase